MARHALPRTLPIAFAALAVAYAPDALAQSAVYERDEPAEVQSAPMMYTGIAMSATGLAGLGAGTAAFFVAANSPGDFAALGAMIYGGAILIPSSILVHIGIPLWAVGASEPDHPERASATPQVNIGAGGGSLRWSF